MFEPKRDKDRLKHGKQSEEVKEDKHLIKLGSLKRHRGHSIFKMVPGKGYIPVESSDFIECMAYLKSIRKDGTFTYSESIKLKEGNYTTALNKRTANKKR